MAAFDTDWWDARCLLGGKVDTCGVPFEGADHVTWIRWRLIDELLQRHFTDVGLEPGFGLMGTELYNVAIYSPTCQRAPRYFGRLCGPDVHPEDDSDLVTGQLGDGKLTWAGAAEAEMLHGGSWDSWTSYLQDAIAALGLGTAGIIGHEGCFHRRGKALTPLTRQVRLRAGLARVRRPIRGLRLPRRNCCGQ